MSALGDYIHLQATNYYKYGTSRRTFSSSKPNYSIEVINNRIKANVKPISK